MTGFRVGVMDPILAARPAADTFTRANYLGALTNRADSFWVPDHLNQLFPRSLWKQKYCGATKLIPRVDAAMEPWTMLGHIAARNRLGRLRLGVGVTDAGRRNPAVTAQAAATLHLLTREGRSWASARVNAKETSPTGWTGPSRWRGLKRRWPPSARYGIRAANSSTGTRPISRCATRYSIYRPIAESGPRSGSEPTVRACCAPQGATETPISPGSRTGQGNAPAASGESFGEAASDVGRDPMSIIPAVNLFVITGRGRDDVDEALESEMIKSFGLTASDEIFARHGARHPMGADFSGSQDLLPHDMDEQTALSHGGRQSRRRCCGKSCSTEHPMRSLSKPRSGAIVESATWC